MEFHHLGSHCAFPDCKQLDFLPFKCNGCNEVFCLEHRTYESHNCKSPGIVDRRAMVCPLCNVPIVALPSQDPNVVLDDHINQGCAVKAPTGYVCNLKGCKKVDVMAIVCKFCRRHHCVKHRFEDAHKCPRKPQKSNPNPKPQTSNSSNSNNINRNTNNIVAKPNNVNQYPATMANANNSSNNNNSSSNNNNNNYNYNNVRSAQPQVSNAPANNRSAQPTVPNPSVYNLRSAQPPSSNTATNNARSAQPPVSTPSANTSASIGVRLTNGDVIRRNCNGNTLLREVQLFIDQNRTDGSAPYVMRTTYPPRDLSYSDLDRTLLQLDLVPSGMIVLQNFQLDGAPRQEQAPNQPVNNYDNSNNGGWWNTISSFFTSFVPSSS